MLLRTDGKDKLYRQAIRDSIDGQLKRLQAQKTEETDSKRSSIHTIIRNALRVPLKIMRERQRRINEQTDFILQTQKEHIERQTNLRNQAPHADGPLMAINMLAVEALFLLENRTALNKPKHYRAIRNSLLNVESYTSSDMGRKLTRVVYSRESDADLTKVISKLTAEQPEQITVS